MIRQHYKNKTLLAYLAGGLLGLKFDRILE
jgi:hypothetical protein